jgi:hypothetical protein
MSDKNEKSIYELELHETILIHSDPTHLAVVRVPNGWIYSTYVAGDNVSSVFVPYHREFKEKKPTKIGTSKIM